MFNTWKFQAQTWGEHVVCINCSEYQNKNKKQFVCTTCSELVVFMYWIGKSMNNILSYYGLLDAKIRASDKDLPIQWPCTTTLSSPGVCITLDKAFQVPFHGHNVPRSSMRSIKHLNTRKNAVLPVQLNFFGTEKRLILQQISQNHHPSISLWRFVCYWLGFW